MKYKMLYTGLLWLTGVAYAMTVIVATEKDKKETDVHNPDHCVIDVKPITHEMVLSSKTKE